MRDHYVCLKQVVALSIDYDGCGDVHNNYEHPDISLDDPKEWPRVRPFSILFRRPADLHTHRKRLQFWGTIKRATGRKVPRICMSGSARVVYQRPLIREQDGMAHTVVIDHALREHGFPGIDLRALQKQDGGIMNYSPSSITWPHEHETVRSKMSIVREQILFIKSIFPHSHVVFVFIDDIYAVLLAKAIRRSGDHTIPENVTLHLIHYESFDAETAIPSTDPECVTSNVVLWSKR